MDYIKTRDDWDLDESHIYEDYASGADKNRPEFNRMLRDAKNGEFKCIVVFQLSRLGRSLTHIVNVITDLRTYKVGIYSYGEQISTLDDNPYTTITTAIFLALADVQRQLISSQVKSALDRLKSEGQILGRPPARFDLELCLKLKKEGMSLRKICKKLGGNISPTTLCRKLQAIEVFHKPASKNTAPVVA